MFKLDAVMVFALEFLRALLAEALLERVGSWRRKALWLPRVRGLTAVRRHLHKQCRRRLFNRLST